MRWFKHITLSSQDELMCELMDKFGAEGYGVWWIILEKIAHNMDDSSRTFARFSLKVWANSAKVSAKKFQKIATFLKTSGTFSLEFDKDYLTIDCKNLLKYRDEWTDRKSKSKEKLGSDSGVTRDLLPKSSCMKQRSDTDKDKEKEKDPTTTPSSALDLLAENAQKILALFGDVGFRFNLVLGNPGVVEMCYGFARAGLTPTEVHVLLHRKIKELGKLPASPKYFEQYILDAKRKGTIIADTALHEKIRALHKQILPEQTTMVWTREAASDLQARIDADYEGYNMRTEKSWRNYFLLVKSSRHIKRHELHLDYLVREKVFAGIMNNKRETDFEEFKKLQQQGDN